MRAAARQKIAKEVLGQEGATGETPLNYAEAVEIYP